MILRGSILEDGTVLAVYEKCMGRWVDLFVMRSCFLDLYDWRGLIIFWVKTTLLTHTLYNLKANDLNEQIVIPQSHETDDRLALIPATVLSVVMH